MTVISSRDPLGEAITDTAIRIDHGGGFSTNHLLESIQMVIEIIIPEQLRERKICSVMRPGKI